MDFFHMESVACLNQRSINESGAECRPPHEPRTDNMGVVVIPAYKRPEFLHWCLKQIQVADGASEHRYIFCLDVGYDKVHEAIIGLFPYAHEIIKRGRVVSAAMQQSYNVLMGLWYAAELTDGLVYLIEDDVMIANDFFAWHEAINKKEGLFCSIASKNVNRTVSRGSNRLEDYYLSSGDYCGIGTAFPSSVIIQKIVPHIKQAYFTNPVSYIRTNLFVDFIGDAYAEQDGLIRRIQHHSELPTAYPFVPRSYHAGFYGKGRQQTAYISGLNERIDFVGSVIFSKEQMAKFALNEHFYYDSEPCNLINNIKYELTAIEVD